MKIIIGLGNPGTRYTTTRHNVGWLVLDHLAKELNAGMFKMEKRFNAEMTTAQITADLRGLVKTSEVLQNEKTLLIKPQTFMNNSGTAVRAVLDYYKLLPRQLFVLHKPNADLTNILTVIHDDIDLPLGTTKLQHDRSAGGHNGVQSIIQHLKTQNFNRIRIGVATPKKTKMPADKFVLENFSADERANIEAQLPHVTELIHSCIQKSRS